MRKANNCWHLNISKQDKNRERNLYLSAFSLYEQMKFFMRGGEKNPETSGPIIKIFNMNSIVELIFDFRSVITKVVSLRP